ncbi:MAG: protein phosphatase 2C domain-containing protein [Polyangiaceae bacterium]|nr:protein phosphatase 2C domain-containing protein [Polyangiaceae bacterium]
MSWVVLGVVSVVVIALVLRAISSQQIEQVSVRSEGARGRADGARVKNERAAHKTSPKAGGPEADQRVPANTATSRNAAAIAAVRSANELFDKHRRDESPGPSAPASRKPFICPVPPDAIPSFDLDVTWDDIDNTVAVALPEEIRAQQKGYRKVNPKEALADKLRFDDAAEIEVTSELFVDALLVEELLSDDPTGPQALITVQGAAHTDRGLRRKQNEDSMLVMPEQIADGMGGHAAGKLASSIAVETIEQAFREQRFVGEPNTFWPRRGDELARCVEMANLAIFERAIRDECLAGMGTTVTAARFCSERQRVYVAHVGDSRCYRIRNGRLCQLTNDHTLAAELGATGRMATHLSRAVGIGELVQVDLMVDVSQPGDLYLICSDGLTKMIPDERIVKIVTGPGDAHERAALLINSANEAGGKDNTTVILLRIEKSLGVRDAAVDREREPLTDAP